MKNTITFLSVILIPLTASAEEPPNPKIDYDGFVRLAGELSKTRDEHRLSERQFTDMSGEKGTVILDARSEEDFRIMHVKGAVHLALTDFTAEKLAKVIPEKTTRILIYCNNNFSRQPPSLVSKAGVVAVNNLAFVSLHAYGYTNVRELGPLVDVRVSPIPFEGKSVKTDTPPAG